MPKYKIISPRFIDGQYVFASPEHPAEIELPEGTKVDPGLLPIDQEIPKTKPHFAQRGAPAPVVAAAATDDDAKGGKKGRASDRSI